MRSYKFNLWLNLVMVVALLLQSSAPVWAAPLDNQAGPNSAEADVRLEVHLERTTLTADNRDSTRVVVLVTDLQGRPVADGTQVALQAEGGHLAERTIETVNGLAMTTLRAGNRLVPGEVQAYIGSAIATASFELVASPNDAVRLDEMPASTNGPFPANLADVVERARNAIQDPALGRPNINTARHEASFEPGRLHFTPLGEDAPRGRRDLYVSLEAITIGGQPLSFDHAPSVQVEGNIARYEREVNLIEEYIARDAGIEQRWRIEENPGLAGDLVVSVEVKTHLVIEMGEGGNGFVFKAVDSQTGQIVSVASYGRALAIDAAGRAKWAKLSFTEVGPASAGLHRYSLKMTLPGNWLSGVSYPLVIDPLIGGLLQPAAEIGEQSEPAVAYNSLNDEYMVVWQDDRDGNNNIYGQIVSADGLLSDENFAVTVASDSQTIPSIAYSANNNSYLAVWRDGTDYIVGQIISATGTLVGPALNLHGAALTTRTNPEVAYSTTAGAWLVAWQELGSGNNDILARSVTGSGSLGSTYTVHDGSQSANLPAVVANGNGQFLVAWEQAVTETGGGFDAYARRVTTSSGVGDAFLVAGTGGSQVAPAVTYSANDDKYLVAWQQIASDYDAIWGQFVHGDASSGQLSGNAFQVNGTEAADGGRPAVTYFAPSGGNGGSYLVAWEQPASNGVLNLMGRRILPSGAEADSVFALTATDGRQSGVALAFSPTAARTMAVWTDERSGNADAYAQLVEADEELRGEFRVHPAAGDQSEPQVTYNPDEDEYLVVWHDYRDGVNDANIYAQRVTGEGLLVGENIVVSNASYHQLNPQLNYAPGHDAYLVIWRHNTNATGSDFNTYGQLISGAGQLVGSPLVVANTGGIKDQDYPVGVLYNSTSEQFLALLRYASRRISGRHVSPTGTMIAPIEIVDLPSEMTLNGVAGSYNPDDDQYLIVWSQKGTNYDVFGRRMNGGGTVITTDLITIAGGAEHQQRPDVMYLAGAGQYLVAWQHFYGVPKQGDIYSQLVAPAGTLSGTPALVSAHAKSEDNPQLALGDNGTAMVVWSRNNGSSTTLTDLYGRRIGSNGLPLRSAFTILAANDEQTQLALAGNGAGRYLLAWQDNRNGNWDVYGSLFQSLKANFAGTPLAGNLPLPVEFLDISTPAGAADAWLWQFGDGSTSTSLAQNPSHSYTQPGTFTVTLTITDTATGESDVLTKTNYTTAILVHDAPVVTINTPLEGQLLSGTGVQVTGSFEDDGVVVSILVNGVAATINGNTFSANIVLAEGNQVIDVVAEDNGGLMGFASRVVQVDDSGPIIEIQAPNDRQSVYTLNPFVSVSYHDFYAAVNTASLTVQLIDENNTPTDITSNLTIGTDEASGTVATALQGDSTYTLRVSLNDTFGNNTLEEISFYVPADPGSIMPPATPERAGWVSGVVYDSTTCNEHLTTCQGLAGAHVTLVYADSPNDPVDGTIVTGPDGFFAFPVDETNVYWLRVEKDGYTYGQREVEIVRERSTATNNIYLTPLDSAVTPCDSNGCSHANSDGSIQLIIPAGAIPVGQTEYINATLFDQVEFLPSGELPPGTWETYAFNLGGDSETVFAQPVTIRIQNSLEFPPGTPIPIGYWNQNTLAWEHVGTSAVDTTGQWVEMELIHFSNYDVNLTVTPPPPSFMVEAETETAEDDACAEGEEGCFINYKSGYLQETIDLPAINILGQPVGMQLRYNSDRAYPSEIIDVRLKVIESLGAEIGSIGWELYIEGQKTDSFTFEANLEGAGEVGRYRYLWDGRNALGEALPPGIYAYKVRLTIPYTTQYCLPEGGIFGQPPDCENGAVGVPISAVKELVVEGNVSLQGNPDSALGAGWVVDGVQQLFEDEKGRILVTNGRRNDEFYFAWKDLLAEQTNSDSLLGWVNFGSKTLQTVPVSAVQAWQGRTFPVAQAPYDIVLSPDEAFAYVSNYNNNKVSIIDLTTEQVVATVSVGSQPRGIAVSPDGAFVYVANSGSSTISAINLDTLQVTPISVGSSPSDIALSFTYNGNFAYVTNTGSDTISIVNLTTMTQVNTTPVGDQPLGIAVENGAIAFVTNYAGNSVSFVTLGNTPQEITRVSVEPGPWDIELAASGLFLYITGGDGRISVVNRNSWQHVSTIDIGNGSLRGIDLSPNGDFAYVVDQSNRRVSVVDLASEVEIDSIGIGLLPTNLVLSADGNSAYVTNFSSTTPRIAVVDLLAQQQIESTNTTETPVDVALSPDGAFAYVTRSPHVVAIDVAAQQQIATIPTSANSKGIALSPDGTLAYVVSYATSCCTGGLYVIDLTTPTPTVINSIGVGHLPYDVAISPDGAYAYVTNQNDDNISVVNVSTEVVTPIDVGDAPKYIALSPDGNYAYVVNTGLGDDISIVDLTLGQAVATANVGAEGDIAVSPDGAFAYVVNGSAARLVVVDLSSSPQVIANISVGWLPNRVVLSADGNFAYVTNGERTISVVDLTLQKQVATIGTEESPQGIALSQSFVPTVGSRTPTDHSTITYDAATATYTRAYPDGRQIHFNADGTHDYTLEPDGRKTAYSYNPDGSVATMSITAPGDTSPDWTWTFDYTDGKLSSITDPAGRATSLDIDGNNNLTQVTYSNGTTRHFYYDQRNLMTQQVDPIGAVNSFTYDEYGRINSDTLPQRVVYDPATGQAEIGQEVRTFKPSDTGYVLINASPVGDPDNPAPAVPTSADLVDEVAYGQGGLGGHTNEWGSWLDTTDALGRTTTLERDEANHITKVMLPNGECITATYDETSGNILSASRYPVDECENPQQEQTTTVTHEPRFNQIKTKTDSLGNVTTYTYDYELGLGESGYLMRVEYPAREDENGNLVIPTVHYTYYANGLLATETDVSGTVTRYVYTLGTPDEAAGGSNPLFAPGVTPVAGYLTQITSDYGDSDGDGFEYTTIYKDFDVLGNAQTTIYPDGTQTTATYDQLGRLLTGTTANGIVTLYEYDSRGRIVRQVSDYTPDGVTGENIVTHYEYDGEGRLVHQRTTTDGLIVETFSRYDVNGWLVSQLDGQGHETRYIYDDIGQLIETVDPAGHSTVFSYTDTGRLETTTDAEGHVSTTIYDDFGRPEQTIQAYGELDLTTVYNYAPDSNLITSIQAPDGTITCFEYDDVGRRTKTIQDCGLGGLNLETSYVYDLAGNLVRTTDLRGIVTYTEYDALGRTTLTRQDEGGLGYETVTTYDAAGNVASSVGPDGTVTEYSYDAYNRLEELCQDSTGLNLCMTYTYDRLGRQETVVDAEGNVQRTVYNSLNLPLQEIADANGLASTISYEYDNLLNLIGVTDPNGNVTRYNHTSRREVEFELYADGTFVGYEYTPRGSVATRTLQDGATISYNYDAVGRQTRLDFSTGGFQTFEYDEASRMTEAIQTMDDHSTVVGYDYNNLGAVLATTQQLDGGTTWLTQYAYNYTLGEQTVTYSSGEVRVYQTDSLNRLDTVETGSGAVIADYSYDLINHFNTIAYPANGVTNRLDYDPLGRTTRVSTTNSLATIADYRYGYDDVGNRTYMQRMHEPNGPADVYVYDGLYQLSDVWYGANATTPAGITTYDSDQHYDLDVLGNRLSLTEDSTTTDYGPNDDTKLTNTMNRYESVEGEPLGYDLRGNTLTDGMNVYGYDVLNRQTSMNGSGGTAEYIYDARGRRVAKVVDGVITHYIYDINYRILEERAADGSLLARYTYGTGIDEVLTMERGGQTYYYHRDALGSVTEVTNATGNLVEHYKYDVYGTATIFDGFGTQLTASAIGNPYLFTGRQYDPESGNYYYRARYYSPELGRFLSADPLGFGSGDYNLYRYVFNNPINGVDPTGEVAWFIPWLLKAGAEAAVDALLQATISYFFDPSVTSVEQAINSIDLRRVGVAFLTGLLPGGRFLQAGLAAVGDVLINYLDALARCDEYTAGQAITDFAFSVATELLFEKGLELVGRFGKWAVQRGFERLGRGHEANDFLRELDLNAPSCGANSFSAETVVATPNGEQAINTLSEGDIVLAYNEKTGELGYYPIVDTISHEDQIVQYLTIDGEQLSTTPNHPFYTIDAEWINAGELQVGDQIRRADGSYGTVQKSEFTYQPQYMYNLSVAVAHTFFVGDGQWLVHNCGYWLGDGTPPKWGYDFALEVDRFYAKLPRWMKNKSTVAIAQQGGRTYITAKGPALQALQELDNAGKLGIYEFVDNLSPQHAEERLYNELIKNGPIDGIAVSHREGPCGPSSRNCTNFFESRGFENIFWTGESK